MDIRISAAIAATASIIATCAIADAQSERMQVLCSTLPPHMTAAITSLTDLRPDFEEVIHTLPRNERERFQETINTFQLMEFASIAFLREFSRACE